MSTLKVLVCAFDLMTGEPKCYGPVVWEHAIALIEAINEGPYAYRKGASISPLTIFDVNDDPRKVHHGHTARGR